MKNKYENWPELIELTGCIPKYLDWPAAVCYVTNLSWMSQFFTEPQLLYHWWIHLISALPPPIFYMFPLMFGGRCSLDHLSSSHNKILENGQTSPQMFKEETWNSCCYIPAQDWIFSRKDLKQLLQRTGLSLSSERKEKKALFMNRSSLFIIWSRIALKYLNSEWDYWKSYDAELVKHPTVNVHDC